MLKGSVLLDNTKRMMMMMMMMIWSVMITQRRVGQPVNLPSLQVVMCTKQTNKQTKKIDKMRIKNILWFFFELPDVLLNGL